MRRASLIGTAWRIAFTQTVIVLVAGLATGTTVATGIAVAFLLSNIAVVAWIERGQR